MFKGLFCFHKWEIIKLITVVNKHGKFIRYDFYMQCIKCGNVKYKKV